MEKNNRLLSEWKDSGSWQQLCRKMKCVLVFMLMLVWGIRAEVWSQQYVLDLQLQETPLAEVFSRMESQTGLKFLYNTVLIESKGRVDVKARKADVRQVLDELLRPLDLSYIIEKDQVVVKKASPAAPREKLVIKGRVTDARAVPLPGVTVRIKGTTVGVVSDNDGRFELALPADADPTLVFSFVGMQTQEVKYTGQRELNISMHEDVSEMEEVVVTGYQTINREKVTGSTSTVSSKQLEERYTPNILNNLEGRVAGLVTYGNKTMIRGTSSMHAETSPLVVVDGLPIEGKIEDLNPYDIESVTVLKDAAAAAIYGARASNGIIVITTKKAKKAGTEIDVSANLTIYEKKNMNYHDNFYMSPAEQVEVENAYWDYYFFRNRNDQNPISTFERNLTLYSPITPIQYAWYQYAKSAITKDQLDGQMEELKKNNFAEEYGEHALRRQFLQQYNLAIRNQGERFNSNLIFNLRRDNNGMINSYDNQVNIAYRASYDMKKWFTVTFGINGILSKRVESGSEYTKDPFNVPSYYRLLNDDGSYNYYSPSNFNQYYTLDDENSALRPMNFNHLEELNYDKLTTDRRNMRYQGELLFKIIDGLTINTAFIYETERQNVSQYSEADSYRMRFLRNIYTVQTGPDAYEYMIPQNGGRLTTEDTRGDYWTARGQLNFRRTFADKHTIDFIGGFEFRETRNRGTKGILLGYDDRLQSHATTSVNFKELYDYQFTTFFVPGYPAQQYDYNVQIQPYLGLVPEENHRYASGYMNATYTYDNRYNLFGSFRKDYADLFGTNAKFRGKPLWSAGASWNMYNEDFLSDVSWLNNLKLRASYGVTGNIYQGATSYMTASTSSNNMYTGKPQATIDSPANPNLKWEKTATVNIGVDFAVLHNRLRGSLDWYNKKGSDIFSQKSLDVSLGFTSINMNMADMENNGIEILLSGDWFRPENEGDFAWTTTVTAAYNKNKITNMEVQATRAYELINNNFKTGYPTSALFSYRYAGLDQVGAGDSRIGLGQPLYWTADGRKVDDRIASADVNSLVYSGQSDPKFNMALDNTLNYKGFSLNFMMVYYGGHKMRVRPYRPLYQMGFGPLADYYVNSWTPENTDTDVPGVGENSYLQATSNVYQYTDIFVQSADFIKIRNITLGYNVPEAFIRRIGLSNLQLRFQIDNLPALWKKNGVGVDPETLGIRRQMTYIAGLQFKF